DAGSNGLADCAAGEVGDVERDERWIDGDAMQDTGVEYRGQAIAGVETQRARHGFAVDFDELGWGAYRLFSLQQRAFADGGRYNNVDHDLVNLALILGLEYGAVVAGVVGDGV